MVPPTSIVSDRANPRAEAPPSSWRSVDQGCCSRPGQAGLLIRGARRQRLRTAGTDACASAPGGSAGRRPGAGPSNRQIQHGFPRCRPRRPRRRRRCGTGRTDPYLVRQRLQVAVDHRGDVVHVVHGGAQVHGERWVLDEPDRIAVARGQRSRAGELQRFLTSRSTAGRYFGGKCTMTSLMCVRAYRGRPSRIAAWPCAPDRGSAVAISSRPPRIDRNDDMQAAREPLDVPFPRAGDGLVEVVNVEHETALGCRELPEVGNVRVTTCLHPQPGDGSRVEVHRHDRGRPPVERERRHGHAVVADRQQLSHACLGLGFEHRDRIRPVRRAPFGVRRGDPASARPHAVVRPRFHGLGSSRAPGKDPASASPRARSGPLTDCGSGPD